MQVIAEHITNAHILNEFLLSFIMVISMVLVSRSF